MSKPIILVVGGAGYIGSHVNKMLHKAGYETIVLDNLSRGNQKCVSNGSLVKGELADSSLLNSIFQSYPIKAVMHFAAHIDVGESIHSPEKYYINNVANTLNLLQSMVTNNVKKLVFSSSAAIYGNPLSPLINEEHPCSPLSPYGRSKWMVEKILADFDVAHGIRYCSLRYFNAAGGDPDGQILNFQTQSSNLIPRILLSMKGLQECITIYGTNYPTPDGTCIRDYIHIEDLGTAHINAMKLLFDGATSNFFNLGSGVGASVKEVIETVQNVLKKKISYKEGDRRAGDPPTLLADSSKAKKILNWSPQYHLSDIIQHAWRAYQMH